jgi:hypothetical protein
MRAPTHWDVAEAFLAVSFIVVLALAGWALGGFHYGLG